jgi:hypothetical protein
LGVNFPRFSFESNISFSSAYSGNSYIVFGSKSTPPLISVFPTDSAAAGGETEFMELTHEGGLLHDNTTKSTTVIGDINNDGFSDLLIGNPQSSICYVYLAGANGFTNLDVSFVIVSNQTGDSFGWAAAGLGDLNHDGFDDVVIAAPTVNVVYVIFGRASFPKIVSVSKLQAHEGFKIVGSSSTKNLGMSISPAKDFNHDLQKDIVLSATTNAAQNLIYVLFLRNFSGISTISMDSLPFSSYLTIVAPKLSFAGFSLAGLGDVNGDGFDDIAIGSVPYQGGYLTQKTYVVFGRATSSGNSETKVYLAGLVDSGGGFEVYGGGFLVAGPGDVNGDGFADLMVVSYRDWQGAGNAYSLVYPTNVTSPPTFLPSSAPSSFPTNHPTISPSSVDDLVISPPLSPSQSAFPSLFPRTKAPRTTQMPVTPTPTIFPTVKSRRPSISPSFLRTLSPSTLSTATKSPRPSSIIRPTTRAPSLLPSTAPSEQNATIPNVVLVPVAGTYHTNSRKAEEFQITATGLVLIVPDSTTLDSPRSVSKIYKIYEVPEQALIIQSFRSDLDVIDLSMFSKTIRNLEDLSFTTNPLILLLPRAQVIKLPSHLSMDLSADNFIFAEGSSAESSSSSNPLTDVVAYGAVLPVAAVIIICVVLYIAAVDGKYADERAKKVEDNFLRGASLSGSGEVEDEDEGEEEEITTGNVLPLSVPRNGSSSSSSYSSQSSPGYSTATGDSQRSSDLWSQHSMFPISEGDLESQQLPPLDPRTITSQAASVFRFLPPLPPAAPVPISALSNESSDLGSEEEQSSFQFVGSSASSSSSSSLSSSSSARSEESVVILARSYDSIDLSDHSDEEI